MVLDKIGKALRDGFDKIRRSVLVDTKLIDEIVQDIQRALLQGDVNVNLVLELSQNIKSRAVNEKPLSGMTKKEQIIKIIYEELTKILGEKEAEIVIKGKKPFKIMLVGLFGSGKTTTISKLARYYSNRGHKVGVVGLDVHRPAAFDQLEQACKKAGVPVFVERKEKDVVKIYKKYEKELKEFDIVLIDTAGRDSFSKELFEELSKLNKAVKPNERILVLSGDIGQAAQEQSKAFHDSIEITGILVTKLDGTAKGGGSLVGCVATGAKIYFIGVGEKIEDLEKFNPEGFVSRLLGMGDLKALLEKAREVVDEDKAKDMKDKFVGGDFNLIDLHEQLSTMKKMGSLQKIFEMVPGMSGLKSKIPEGMLENQEKNISLWKHIMNSMTKEELERPDEVVNGERIKRIAKGAGVDEKDVREMIKQYKQSKKMMKMMKGQNPEKLMKKFKGKLPI